MILEQLFAEIEKRPEMYISTRSINSLRVFFDGVSLGQAFSEPKSDLGNLGENLRKFQDWLVEKYNVSINQSWDGIILYHSPGEKDALERFFDLYREFKYLNNE